MRACKLFKTDVKGNYLVMKSFNVTVHNPDSPSSEQCQFIYIYNFTY